MGMITKLLTAAMWSNFTDQMAAITPSRPMITAAPTPK